MVYERKINEIIKNALEEDIGSGDITTTACIPPNAKAKGEFIIKQDGVAAGFNIAEKVFKSLDPSILFKKNISDGEKVFAMTIAAVIDGNAAAILTAERTALNFLQRMSGIATLARAFADKIKNTNAQIIDTRKTAPGLRLIDKLAVKLSGCVNHRTGLFDMFLIKDNHIAVAGSILNAVKACEEFRRKKKLDYKIEVETTNLDQVEEAIKSGADIIMLDNFKIDLMKKAVELINGRCKTEASGMVTLETVKEIAETGVDYISVGAITHSVKALDISLEIKIK